MIESELTDVVDVNEEQVAPGECVNAKRDIVRFNGTVQTAINLEHVSNIYINGNRLTFQFYAKEQFIDFESNEAAASAFEDILKVWSS